jgi:ferredoxin
VADELTIVVDRDTCIGSGMCVMYAPGTFEQDEEAKSFVIDPAGDSAEDIAGAVDACPTRALRLVNSEESSPTD